MNDAQHRYLVRAAARAEGDPFFIGFALAAYRDLAGFDDRQLGTWLGCPLQNLPRLALCRRPDGESAMFGDEVQRIARYVEVEAGRLAQLLRAVENVEAMQGAAPGALMAARDRKREGAAGGIQQSDDRDGHDSDPAPPEGS